MLAAQVANAIADGYLVRQREAKEEQAKTRRAVACRPDRHDAQKVEEAEAKVEDFRAKIQSFDRHQQHHALGPAARRHQCAARRRARAKGRRRGQGQDDPRHAAAPASRSNPPIFSIRNSSAGWPSNASPCARSLPSSRRRCSTIIRESRNCRAQIADLDNQIRAEAETIARSFENDAKLAGVRGSTR